MCWFKFIRGVKYDNIKNNYAFNNIPILRIPYIYEPKKDRHKIKTLISEFVTTKIIPQEIVDFYKNNSPTNYAEYAAKYNAIKREN